MEKIPQMVVIHKSSRKKPANWVIENGISTGEAANRLALLKLMIESDI